MMDDAVQRDVAKLMVNEFRQRDIEIVLVGSTAITALNLFPKTTRDADALGPTRLTLDHAREIMKSIGEKFQLEFQERGWGTLSVVKYDETGEERWRMDLIVPDDGPIPAEAALIIHNHAVQTDIGLAAIPEHILVMKAVAWGDSHGKGDAQRATEYESDVMELKRRLKEEPRWPLVQELLDAYPDARAGFAVGLLKEKFGVKLREEAEWGNW